MASLSSPIEKYVTRVMKTDQLIRRKETGSPKALAGKLNVSESTVFRLIKVLRENMKLSIEFSNEHDSYIYQRENESLDFERLSSASKNK